MVVVVTVVASVAVVVVVVGVVLSVDDALDDEDTEGEREYGWCLRLPRVDEDCSGAAVVMRFFLGLGT